MCGITAVLSKVNSPFVLQYLLEGIKALQNRGYDSCGGTLTQGLEQFWTWKRASTQDHTAIEQLNTQVQDSSVQNINWRCGCFQTRWATHGPKTDANAHPHSDQKERFYVVHNGIITNYAALKARLQKKGYVFKSDTDTEVVAHMVADALDVAVSVGRPYNMLWIWKSVIRHLEGTWSLIMMDREHPSWLYVAKHGSPLIMSYSEDGSMLGLSSEIYGIRFKTRQYEDISDGAAFIVDENLNLMDEGDSVQGRRSTISHSCIDVYLMQQTSPKPYRFWTELEILQQPITVWDAMNRGGRLYNDQGENEGCNWWHVKLGGLERVSFDSIRHVVLVGCGTSMYAAQHSSKVFRTVTKLETVQVFDASEITPADLKNLEVDQVLVVFVSQSGETKDCQRVLEWCKERSYLTVGIVNVVGSWLARHTDCGVYLNAGREVGVASTKSFTSQCVVLTLLALWLGNKRTIQEWCPRVYNLPDVFTRNMEALDSRAKELARAIKYQRSIFILGRGGFSYSVALEGALKLKELTGRNVEGYAGGALKHGPFAVLGPDATVFLQCWSNDTNMLSATEQVVSRNAKTVMLYNIPGDEMILELHQRFPSTELVYIGSEDEWSASLLSVVLYQFMAFYLALEMGLNPDMPRNLAKVVTVDG